MYTLKVPAQSEFTQLNRAFNTYLNDNKIEMKDRRLVTAYTLGRIVGGSLPVFDMATRDIRSRTFREQLLPNVKAFCDRLGEAMIIDHELVIIGSFMEWCRRSSVAFPMVPRISDEALDGDEYGYQQQTAVLSVVMKTYPNLTLDWVVGDLLTQKGE